MMENRIVWFDASTFVSGEPDLELVYPTGGERRLGVRPLRSARGLWVTAPLSLPPQAVIRAAHVCYEATDLGSSITSIEIRQSVHGESSEIVHDEKIVPAGQGLVCYRSPLNQGVRVEGAVTLALRLDLDVGETVMLRSVGIELENFDTVLNVREAGAAGDGTDATPVIKSAIASLAASGVGGDIEFPPGRYRISADLTVPKSVRLVFATGAVLELDSGVRFEIGGGIEAPIAQIFDAPIPPGPPPEITREHPQFWVPTTGVKLEGPIERIYPQWWGAQGDGAHDDGPAVQSAIYALPLSDLGWSGGLRAARNFRVVFPMCVSAGSGGDSAYRINSPVQIPVYRSVHFDSDGPLAARIVNGTPEDNDYLFVFRSRGLDGDGNLQIYKPNLRTVSVRNLVFHRGGLDFEFTGGPTNGSTQLFTRVSDCEFLETPGPAIRIGERIVSGEVDTCVFDRTGGVHFTEPDSDGWVIRRCFFNRGRWGPDILIRSSGVHVENCNFESHEGAFEDGEAHVIRNFLEFPFIQVTRGPDVRIVNNRFGNEPSSTVTGPPREILKVGPSSTGSIVNGLQVIDNVFRGLSKTHPAESGEVAIAFHSSPQDCTVSQNQFWNYRQIVSEPFWVTASGAQEIMGKGTKRCRFESNLFQNRLQEHYSREDLFEHGGVGFVGQFATQDPNRLTANLLPHPGKIEKELGQSWKIGGDGSTLRIYKDQVGPDGRENSAYTFYGRGHATCMAISNAVPYVERGPVVASVYARAGDGPAGFNVIRLAIVRADGGFLTALNDPITISREWKRYSVMAPKIQRPSDSAPEVNGRLRLAIYLGADGQRFAERHVHIAFPRLERGDTPTETPNLSPARPAVVTDFITQAQHDAGNHSDAFKEALAYDNTLHIPPGVYKIKEVELPSGAKIECARGAIIDGVDKESDLFWVSDLKRKVSITGGAWRNCRTVLRQRSTKSLSASTFEQMTIIACREEAFVMLSSVGNVWRDCEFLKSSTAILFAGGVQSNQNRFVNCRFQDLDDWCVNFEAVEGSVKVSNRFEHCWFENNRAGGVYSQGGAYGLSFEHCYFEVNSRHRDRPDIKIKSRAGTESRNVVVRECFFPPAGRIDRTEGVHHTSDQVRKGVARIVVSGRSQIIAEDNHVLLKDYLSEVNGEAELVPQVFVHLDIAAIDRHYTHELHRNYINSVNPCSPGRPIPCDPNIPGDCAPRVPDEIAPFCPFDRPDPPYEERLFKKSAPDVRVSWSSFSNSGGVVDDDPGVVRTGFTDADTVRGPNFDISPVVVGGETYAASESELVRVDPTLDEVKVTLPEGARKGARIAVCNQSDSAESISIEPASGHAIDGSEAPTVLSAARAKANLVFDGERDWINLL